MWTIDNIRTDRFVGAGATNLSPIQIFLHLSLAIKLVKDITEDGKVEGWMSMTLNS